MSFEIETRTFKWLLYLAVIAPTDVTQTGTSTLSIKEDSTNQFISGHKVGMIIAYICKRKGLPVSGNLSALKYGNTSATRTYNWNIINEALKKIGADIDSRTKSMIINGDGDFLALLIRKLQTVYEKDAQELEDSLDSAEQNLKDQLKKNQGKRYEHKSNTKTEEGSLKYSLTLSRSQDPRGNINTFVKSKHNDKEKGSNVSEMPLKNANGTTTSEGDLVEYVVYELMRCLKLTRKQAVALLSDNNKYLAHVLVKGVKGDFGEIEELMARWFADLDSIVEKMTYENDMCLFFLQVIKPSLLSKSEDISQWGCRILSKIAYLLADRKMLPLAYDWFVREAGGLSTTILALMRHPKLNEHVVSYILQFSRYNIADLFTVELKKITNNDNLMYIRFMLLIFDPLISSKTHSYELLNSGAIDYWIYVALKNAYNNAQNSKYLRLYCLYFLTNIWRAFPIHVEETLDKVNDIMGQIKRGTREDSYVMKFSIVELIFNLLDYFASKKNPYASVVYKKLTFQFIYTHEYLTMREFMLRNIGQVFNKYQSMPVETFMEPFIKQVKTRESKSYFINIFDIEFIQIVAGHRKLGIATALELFDLLAKTKLNSHSFAGFTDEAMGILLDRFLTLDEDNIFFDYTVKLVKITMAMFYSSLKTKKQFDDSYRIQAQKRAYIVNFVVSLIYRSNHLLNYQIKFLVVHVKIQIQNRLNCEHKGIDHILSYFSGVYRTIAYALENMKDETESNATQKSDFSIIKHPGSKYEFHLPKIYSKHNQDDEISQQSFQSHASKLSDNSKQYFQMKDYSKFAEEDEKKFIRENKLGIKKKYPKKIPPISLIDPKTQYYLARRKQIKEEYALKRQKEQEIIYRKKESLKQKIQKELKQRNLMQGLKGNEKNVETRLVFEENYLNYKLFDEEDDDLCKKTLIGEEEKRDSESVKLVLNRYSTFWRKIFNKYSCAKAAKKDYFDEQNGTMEQIDLLKLCKYKNLYKNKLPIIEILKTVNDRNIKSVNIDGFRKFLEGLCVYSFVKEKCSPHLPMGDHMKSILKRISIGYNIKLYYDEDYQTKALTYQVRYNPHIELQYNYKKVYEQVYESKKECTFSVKRAIQNDSLVTCYEVVNELLAGIFKFNVIEEEVVFKEYARVLFKKNSILPPRVKKEEAAVSLLEYKEKLSPTAYVKRSSSMKRPSDKGNNLNRSLEKENSKPKQKIINQAERKKMEEEEAKILQKQAEDEQLKQRQAELKKRMYKMQYERYREKSAKKEYTKALWQQYEEKKRKYKYEKDRYLLKQKEKIEKYKREQEEKEKEDKEKQREVRAKEYLYLKYKLKATAKKYDYRRKEYNEKLKREREQSEYQNRKKKEEYYKKKEALKKQIMKKLYGEKYKYELSKLYKYTLKKVYQYEDMITLLTGFKEELRGIFNYGKYSNEYKLGDLYAQNCLYIKGWLAVCQQLSICDSVTAGSIIKNNQKEKGRSSLTYDYFQYALLNLAIKKDIYNDLDDYEKVHPTCLSRMYKFLKGLKIPHDKQGLKYYFLSLKHNPTRKYEPVSKAKEEIHVENPDGDKYTWEIYDK